MSMGDKFLVGVCLLQACAGFAYLAQGDWRQTFVWWGIVVSNAAYLSLTRG